MKLEQSFEVAAPLERVWEALIDVQRVAPCLPGAEIEPDSEDGTYRGSFTVKLGPTTASYRGQLQMEEVDEAARRVVMRASGQDKRGQGTAKATIVSVMRVQGDGTRWTWRPTSRSPGAWPASAAAGWSRTSEPPASGLRELPAELDRVGAAERLASPAAPSAHRTHASPGRSRSAVCRCSSARCWIGCVGCSVAGAEPGTSRLPGLDSPSAPKGSRVVEASDRTASATPSGAPARRRGAGRLAGSAARPRAADQGARRRAGERPRPAAHLLRGAAVPGRLAGRAACGCPSSPTRCCSAAAA